MAKKTSETFEKAAGVRLSDEEKAYFEIIGQNIRATRNAIGMSQETLAEALGVTFQQVQKYEKGINRISIRRLGIVAEALGVPMNTLLPKEHQLPKPINSLTQVWDSLPAAERKKMEGRIKELAEKYGETSGEPKPRL